MNYEPLQSWPQLVGRRTLTLDANWLVFASLFYGVGRKAHTSIYKSGFKKRKALPRPTICIGNLTVGGTGKTPFLIGLADELKMRGLRSVILSRGYRAVPPAREPRSVSNGREILVDAERAGDEPHLIARSCPEIPVIIGASRFDAGNAALREFTPDLFIMDDGFQHEALSRDLDLVLWDLRDMPSKMHLLPAGRLREGLGGLKRASVIILTHSEYVEESGREARVTQVTTQLKLHAPHAPIFQAETRFTGYRELSRNVDCENFLRSSDYRPIADLGGKKVVVLSGLARPDGFDAMLKESGVHVLQHYQKPDHARFTAEIIDESRVAFKKHNADMILTTEKDAVKLEAQDLDLTAFYALGLSMRITEPERWNLWLDSKLEKLGLLKNGDHGKKDEA